MIIDRKENTGGVRRTEACTMLVSISKIREGGLYGHILHVRLKNPVPYYGTCDLLLKADAIERRFGPPGSVRECRSSRGAPGTDGNLLLPEYGEEVPENYREAQGWGREFYRLGTKETLYLQIAGRQNYSMQGRIRGNLTGGKYICFRSGMELMRLLSELPDRNKSMAAEKGRRREEK